MQTDILNGLYKACQDEESAVITPHAQRERGKVIGCVYAQDSSDLIRRNYPSLAGNY